VPVRGTSSPEEAQGGSGLLGAEGARDCALAEVAAVAGGWNLRVSCRAGARGGRVEGGGDYGASEAICYALSIDIFGSCWRVVDPPPFRGEISMFGRSSRTPASASAQFWNTWMGSQTVCSPDLPRFPICTPWNRVPSSRAHSTALIKPAGAGHTPSLTDITSAFFHASYSRRATTRSITPVSSLPPQKLKPRKSSSRPIPPGARSSACSMMSSGPL
jgi:hypothetical protein